jgi:hypothetical protein
MTLLISCAPTDCLLQGQKASVDDKTASAAQTVALDNKLGGRGIQV